MSKDEMWENSFTFALRIVRLNRYLAARHEFVLSKQVLRSGIAIGANITESKQAESRADFIHKLSIANKEAFETEYWLLLLREARFITKVQADSLISDCNSLQRMLIRSIKTAKSKKH
jgi:four helix bundle protein